MGVLNTGPEPFSDAEETPKELAEDEDDVLGVSEYDEIMDEDSEDFQEDEEA